MSSRSGRRVVVTDFTFPQVDVERAAATAAGAEFVAHQCRSADEVVEAVAGADVAVVQFAPFTAEAVATMADGGGVIRYGIGFDNIDVGAARARDIGVGYVPDYCTAEVADHATSMALAALRKLPLLDATVRDGRWNAASVAAPMPAFSQTTIGFLGLGRIGSAVLERLTPFGFRFLVCDPAADPVQAAGTGAELVDADTLFARSDLISLHLPATPETHHVVGESALRSMKDTAVVVNTARGSLVDEVALAEALHDGRLGGAALDVTEVEPLPAESPLRTAPNLLLSPHAAWYSDAAIVRLQQLVADDIGRLLRGGAPRCPVPGPAASSGRRTADERQA